MKSISFIILLFLISYAGVNAQSRLEMRNEYIINGNSIRIGDSLAFYFTLYNSGSIPYQGDITTYLTTNLDTTPMVHKLTNIQVDTGLIDTFPIIARFAVKPPHFQQHIKSIIVIWPTGTGTTILGDTFVAEDVPILQNVSISEQNNLLRYVSFYPNPTRDVLYFKYLNPDIRIRKMQLLDLQGREVPLQYSDFDQSGINFGSYDPGVYILNIEYNNRKTSQFKVVKTD